LCMHDAHYAVVVGLDVAGTPHIKTHVQRQHIDVPGVSIASLHSSNQS